MPDKIVTLATFSDPVEARLTKNRLEAEGIPASLSGNETAGLCAGFRDLGSIQLLVSEANLDRARAILASEDGEESVEAQTAREPPSTDIQAPSLGAQFLPEAAVPQSGERDGSAKDEEDEGSTVSVAWTPDD